MLEFLLRVGPPICALAVRREMRPLDGVSLALLAGAALYALVAGLRPRRRRLG